MLKLINVEYHKIINISKYLQKTKDLSVSTKNKKYLMCKTNKVITP